VLQEELWVIPRRLLPDKHVTDRESRERYLHWHTMCFRGMLRGYVRERDMPSQLQHHSERCYDALRGRSLQRMSEHITVCHYGPVKWFPFEITEQQESC
jgi:hypothetical protein